MMTEKDRNMALAMAMMAASGAFTQPSPYKRSFLQRLNQGMQQGMGGFGQAYAMMGENEDRAMKKAYMDAQIQHLNAQNKLYEAQGAEAQRKAKTPERMTAFLQSIGAEIPEQNIPAQRGMDVPETTSDFEGAIPEEREISPAKTIPGQKLTVEQLMQNMFGPAIYPMVKAEMLETGKIPETFLSKLMGKEKDDEITNIAVEGPNGEPILVTKSGKMTGLKKYAEEGKTTAELRTFEMQVFGKEVPELRGTPQYLKALRDYKELKTVITPFVQFVPTDTGIMAGNARTGQLSPTGSGKPLPEGQLTRGQLLETLERLTDTAERLYKKEWVGPVAGRIGTTAEKLTALDDPNQSIFYATTKNVQDILVRERTGANLNEKEVARLMSFMFDPNLPGGTFKARLKAFRESLADMKQSRQSTLEEGGYKPKKTGKTKQGSNYEIIEVK